MSRASSNYEISHVTGICAATGRALEPGEMCIATLSDREDDEGFDRHDYSQKAWDSGSRPERLFSYWQTTVPAPDAKPHTFVDDDLLLQLFDRLVDDDRPQRVAFRFVIGLILMRKKHLKYLNHRDEGGQMIWLMRSKGATPDDPPIELINPQLSDDDIRTITDQLGEILHADFE